MRKPIFRTALVCAGMLAAFVILPAWAQAAGSPAAVEVLTDAQIAALSPQAQAVRLTPLRTAANAVGAAGSGSLADIYGNLSLDANHELVDVYLTDPTQTARVIAAAKAVDPTIDTALIRFHPAAATHRALDAAAVRVLAMADAHQLPYKVDLIGPAADASGLELDVEDVAAAKAASVTPAAMSTAAAVGVPIVFRPGHTLVPKAWRDTKWHDSSPFIGGDAITGSGSGHGCTAGLPAVRKSDNHPIMVTAAHCFGVGAKVYTRAGTTGDYSNGLKGNYVGTVTARAPQWDAETIDGADNNADVSDATTWIRLTSTAYSWKGDYVCQDGQRSFYMGHPTPCGIHVTNPDMWCGPTTGCPGLGYNARGVWGEAAGWGSAGGDSGATIFAYTADGGAQARGILSDGDPADGAPGVFWTEAIDVFNNFGLKLNPRT